MREQLKTNTIAVPGLRIALGLVVLLESVHFALSAAAGHHFARTGCFFFSSRRRHTRSVSAFLLTRSSDLERPVKAAELFAFTLRVRAGNTDVLTDAEENVRQKLRAEGVM